MEMKTKFFVVFVAVISAAAIGCGSSPSGNNAVKTATNATTDQAKVGTTTASPANGEQTQIPGITGPENSANVDVNTPGAGNVEQKRRQIVDVPANGPLPKPMAVEASEDSTMVTIMDKTGIATETRTFRSDQYIARLVKQTSSNGTKATIYLKNGKAVSVDASKIPQANAVSIATLRELAGIKPSAASTDTGSKGTSGTGKKPQ